MKVIVVGIYFLILLGCIFIFSKSESVCYYIKKLIFIFKKHFYQKDDVEVKMSRVTDTDIQTLNKYL